MSRLLTFCILLILSSCAPQQPAIKTGTLYPANEQAQQIGPLKLQLTWNGLSGPVSMVMPNGEALNGQYSIIDTSVSGSGSAVATTTGNVTSNAYINASGTGGTSNANMYGYSSGRANTTARSNSQITPGAMPGRIAMLGQNGLNGNCDFMMNKVHKLRGVMGTLMTNNTTSSNGNGNCKLSNGAEYNLMF